MNKPETLVSYQPKQSVHQTTLSDQDVYTQWQAFLSLTFSARVNEATKKTRLSRCRHKGPLYVQKPFYPEGDAVAHVYLLHPPGGVVSGDTLEIDIEAQAQSHALITTPGAGRMYRARDDRLAQNQSVNLVVQNEAVLEWMPLETIIFNDANVNLSTHVQLAPDAIFMGWEVMCLGLPACDELFDLGTVNQSFEIWRGESPVYIDRLLIDESNNTAMRKSAIGFQCANVSGVFIVAAPQFDEALLEAWQAWINEQDNDFFAGVSQVSNDCLVFRYLGESAEQARAFFVAVWSKVRYELMGRPACSPRIWAT